MELEDEIIMVCFHKEVHKVKDKSWHGKHIKKNNFEGDLVLLFDSKYL
jgi:hypothetical protein